MIAHGRYLRQCYGPEAFIVFVGPCIAKKGEAADPAVAGAIDAVLTYTEVEEWLAEAGLAFPAAEPALTGRNVPRASTYPGAAVPTRGRVDRHRPAGYRPALDLYGHRLGPGDLREHARGHPLGDGAGRPGRDDGLRGRLH